MPASLTRIRKSMKVEQTDKGASLTLRLVAYDNGLVTLDGIPINKLGRDHPAAGWTGAMEVMAGHVNEFQRVFAKRRKGQSR